MAEESDLERTEPASQRRREQAREEGQVARSGELSTFAIALAGAATLWFAGGRLSQGLQAIVHRSLSFDRARAFDPALLPDELRAEAAQALLAFIPFGIALLAAATLAPLLLSGWNFTARALAPDFERLDPLAGLRRMFSWQSLVELAKSLAKAALITLASMWVMWFFVERVLGLSALPLPQAVAQAASVVGLSFLVLVGAMQLIVAVDVPYQLWSFGRRLRMTRDELRKELKETEGDPHLKARVRSLQREAARRRMMAQVPKADVVVTNPSHYAVALRYRNSEMRAPQVVAKGMNLIAARIREIAEENAVPVLEAPPLARALYRHSELDREIPAALYAAVAQVLAWVLQLAHWRAHGGVPPPAPGAIKIPAGLDPGASTP